MKKLFKLLTITVLLFVVCACTNNTVEVSENSNTSEDSAAPVEIENYTPSGKNSEYIDNIPFNNASKFDVLSDLPSSLTNGTAVAVERFHLISQDAAGLLVNQLGDTVIMRTLFLDKNGNYLKYYSDVILEGLSDENYEAMKDLKDDELAEYISEVYNDFANENSIGEKFTKEDFDGMVFSVEELSDVEKLLSTSRFIGVRYVSDLENPNPVQEDESGIYIRNDEGNINYYYNDDLSVKEAVIDAVSDDWVELGTTNLSDLGNISGLNP